MLFADELVVLGGIRVSVAINEELMILWVFCEEIELDLSAEAWLIDFEICVVRI